MRVENLKLTGYRRLANCEIEFREGLNLIVGQNNSGKTSLLQALAVLLGTGAAGHPGTNFSRDQTRTESCSIEAVLRPSDEEWCAASAHLSGSEERLEPGQEYGPEVHGGVEAWPSGVIARVICRPGEGPGQGSGLLPADVARVSHYGEHTLSALAGRLAEAFYHRRFSQRVLIAPVYLGGGARNVGPADATAVGVGEYGREHAAPGGRLGEYLILLSDEQRQNYTNSLRRVMGSDFLAAANYQPSSAQVRTIVQDTRGWMLDADWQGSGAQWAMVVLAAVHGPSWGPILIDEIETSLHPDLAVDLVEVLREESLRSGKQVIATTQSDLVVAGAGPDELLVMTPEQSRGYQLWTARRPSAADENALDSALDSLGVSSIGPSALRLLEARVVVAVEGKTDAALLRAMARASGSDDFGRLRAVPVPLGGVDRVLLAALAAKVLGNAHAYPKALICVMDRDERSDAEIDEQKKRAAPAILHVLERREIENYLLDVRAIARVLHAKAKGKREEDSEKVVGQKLAELADEHRFATQRRRAISRLYRRDASRAKRDFARELKQRSPQTEAEFVRLLAEVDDESDQCDIRQIWREVGTELDTVWEKQKLCLAPGGRVLSAFRRWAQDEFGSAPTNASIARELGELPQDLQGLFSVIREAARTK